MTAQPESAPRVFMTDLPARLDRLPWSGWHWRVIIALGITWVLDGLEVTLVGAIAGVLREPQALHLTDSQIGAAASAYLFGAIVGALVFGRLTDRLGRKKLFMITLAVYLCATLATSLSVGFVTFALFRAATGAGIGGEYAAINSAVDELVPARLRGRIDLAVNSTYWLGTALGAASTLILLNPHYLPVWLGWRLAFGLGAILGLSVLFVRRHVPESPRWLLLHGRLPEAAKVVCEIESEVVHSTRASLPPPGAAVRIEAHGAVSFRHIAKVLLQQHLRRSLLGLSLMVAQAFAYNAVFFTYALVLTRFYAVPPGRVGLYILPLAAGNIVGPLALGRLFDTVGRRTMIAVTYGTSGVLMALVGIGFAHGWLSATTQTIAWCAVFFFGSAAASSAYLTVSELFPVELRGMAIALFYVAGTAVGGLAAPALFGALIQTGQRGRVMIGYLIGAGLMLLASVVAAVLGVNAERQSLEALRGNEGESDAVLQVAPQQA